MRDKSRNRHGGSFRTMLFLGLLAAIAWYIMREREKSLEKEAAEVKQADDEEIDVEDTFVDVVAAEEDLSEFALVETNYVLEEVEIGEHDEIDLALEEDIENGDIDEDDDEDDYGDEFGEYSDFEEIQVTLVETVDTPLPEPEREEEVEEVLSAVVEELTAEEEVDEELLELERQLAELQRIEDEIEIAETAVLVAEVEEAALEAELEGQLEDELEEELEAPEPEKPPTWVHPVNGQCPEGFPIKARFSTGRYHQPGDRGYDKVVPDCCYENIEDASADGFTPSRWS